MEAPFAARIRKTAPASAPHAAESRFSIEARNELPCQPAATADRHSGVPGDPCGQLPLRGQDRRRPATGHGGEALLPFASATLRQEPLRRHPQAAVRRAAEPVPRAGDRAPLGLVGALPGGAARVQRGQLQAARTPSRESYGAASPDQREAGVEEYDRPMPEALERPAIAAESREDLRGLHLVIESCDGQLRFSFPTEVSNVSEASPRWSLNNLGDVTRPPGFLPICGCTDRHLDTVHASRRRGPPRTDPPLIQIQSCPQGRDRRLRDPFDMLVLTDERRVRAMVSLERHSRALDRLGGMLASSRQPVRECPNWAALDSGQG